jgi:hypothetical protein
MPSIRAKRMVVDGLNLQTLRLSAARLIPSWLLSPRGDGTRRQLSLRWWLQAAATMGGRLPQDLHEPPMKKEKARSYLSYELAADPMTTTEQRKRRRWRRGFLKVCVYKYLSRSWMAVIWPVTQSYGPVCFNHKRGIDSNKTWDKESRKIILGIYTTFCFHIIFPTGLVELTVILSSGRPLVYFATVPRKLSDTFICCRLRWWNYRALKLLLAIGIISESVYLTCWAYGNSRPFSVLPTSVITLG